MDKKELLSRLVYGLSTMGGLLTFFGIFNYLISPKNTPHDANLVWSLSVLFEIVGIILLVVTIILYFKRRNLIMSETKPTPS
jgi:hypothetical protein